MKDPGSGLPTSSEGWQQAGRSRKKRKPHQEPVVIQRGVKAEDFAKAQAEVDALLSSRKRARDSGQLPAPKRPSPSVRIPSAAPADVEMVTEEPPLDPKNAVNPTYPLRAAVKVGNLDRIGNQYGPPLGYGLKVNFDAGRLGVPTISLIFRINKGNQAETLSTDNKKVWMFTFTFKFNVLVKRMENGEQKGFAKSIQQFSTYHVNPSNPQTTEDREAIEGCPQNKKDAWADKLTTFVLATNKTWYDPKDIPDLDLIQDLDLRATIAALLQDQFLVIRIWFRWRSEGVAWNSCFEYMKHAFDANMPPLA